MKKLWSQAGTSRSTTPVDIIDKLTGTWGTYQLYICLLLLLTKFTSAFQIMAILFLAPKVDYVCLDSGENKMTCPCKKPKYDTSVFSHTIIMEWNLICDKAQLAHLTQTFFHFGILIGSVSFGMASDRYGRKYPMIIAGLFQFIFSTCAPFARNFWLFTFIRFIVGIATGATLVVGFVIVMEFVATKHRQLVSALFHVPFNVGHLLLPGIAYFIRDYVNFDLAISVPGVILLSYFCLLPETPRWLIAAKKTDKAVAILERIARVNKLPTGNIRAEVEAYAVILEAQHVRKGTIIDLFRTPNIRKNILAISFNWLTCSYYFYGVSQYVGHLTGNVFVNVAASAVVTMLGTLGSIPLMRLLGRKTILLSCNAICGISLIVLVLLPEGPATVVLAIIGMVASFIVFVVVYLYTSELFPTVVRSAAVGFSSMMARVGSMIAPQIVHLESLHKWMPPVFFGIMPIIAVVITLLLPETKGCEFMTTIEEGEAFGKKPPKR